MPAVDPDSELIISWNGDVRLNKNWKNRTVTRNSPRSPWTVDSVIFAAVRRKKAQTSAILQASECTQWCISHECISLLWLPLTWIRAYIWCICPFHFFYSWWEAYALTKMLSLNIFFRIWRVLQLCLHIHMNSKCLVCGFLLKCGISMNSDI